MPGARSCDPHARLLLHESGLLRVLHELLHIPARENQGRSPAAAAAAASRSHTATPPLPSSSLPQSARNGTLACLQTWVCTHGSSLQGPLCRVARKLQALSGYISALPTPANAAPSSRQARAEHAGPAKGRRAAALLPAIKVEHKCGDRVYSTERLLHDAAMLPGGFVSVCEQLVCFLCSLHGAVRGAGDGAGARRGGARGGVFFVQSILPNSGGTTHFFDSALVQKQMHACALVDAAIAGRCILPTRAPMRTFWCVRVCSHALRRHCATRRAGVSPAMSPAALIFVSFPFSALLIVYPHLFC